MKVFVEACWAHHSYYRLVFPWHGHVIREYVDGVCWTRAVAAEALDVLESVYHLPRRKVRFVHR